MKNENALNFSMNLSFPNSCQLIYKVVFFYWLLSRFTFSYNYKKGAKIHKKINQTIIITRKIVKYTVVNWWLANKKFKIYRGQKCTQLLIPIDI